MTGTGKLLISKLLEGYYLRPWVRPSGSKCYRLYDTTGQPVRNVRHRTVQKITKHISHEIKIWKVYVRGKKKGRMILSVPGIRKLHGNNIIKLLYKKKRTVIVKPIVKKETDVITQTEPECGQIQIQFTAGV